MSDYSKATDFAAKDALTTGDPDKIVKGTEIDTEFNNISTAVATKADKASPALTGTATAVNLTATGTLTASGTINFTGATISNGGTVTTINIDGGTIDGTAIGGTTPAAGAFTTLSSSGLATLATILTGVVGIDTYAEFEPVSGGTFKTRMIHSPGFGLDISSTLKTDAASTLAMHIQEDTAKVFVYQNFDVAGNTQIDGTLDCDSAVIFDTTLNVTGLGTFTVGVDANNFIEGQFSVTGTTPALDPANGALQYWTLSANSTPTISLANGENFGIQVLDGTAYTITWPAGVKWIGGAAPTLDTTNPTHIEVWQVNSVIYAALVGVSS
jgi:hypothetical protein